MKTFTDTITKITITIFARENSQLQNIFSQSPPLPVHCIFASNEQEPAWPTQKKLHQQRWPTVTTAKIQHPLSHWDMICCLVSIDLQSVHATFFHMEKFSDNPLLHTYSHVRWCLSVTATACNGILLGRFSPYCHTTSIHLWRHGPT